MTYHSKKGMCIALVSFFACFVPVAADAAHMAVSQVADGTRAYVGFVHTQNLAQKIKLNPELYGVHGTDGIKVGKHKYHLVVTLFDSTTGERITDAKIKAKVVSLGFGGSFVELPGTTVAGAIGHCGFFDMPPHDLYVIELKIRRADVAHEIKMRFEHEPTD